MFPPPPPPVSAPKTVNKSTATEMEEDDGDLWGDDDMDDSVLLMASQMAEKPKKVMAMMDASEVAELTRVLADDMDEDWDDGEVFQVTNAGDASAMAKANPATRVIEPPRASSSSVGNGFAKPKTPTKKKING
jgi:hypothetical protein